MLRKRTQLCACDAFYRLLREHSRKQTFYTSALHISTLLVCHPCKLHIAGCLSFYLVPSFSFEIVTCSPDDNIDYTHIPPHLPWPSCVSVHLHYVANRPDTRTLSFVGDLFYLLRIICFQEQISHTVLWYIVGLLLCLPCILDIAGRFLLQLVRNLSSETASCHPSCDIGYMCIP